MDGNLRKIFRERLPQVHWVSIETGGTGRGIPDSNACYNGSEWWVEFKLTNGWAVNLRPEQIGWLLQRTRAGGRTFIAIRRRADELWLFEGAFARELKDYGLRGAPPPIGRWSGGPSAWDWGQILQLFSKIRHF